MRVIFDEKNKVDKGERVQEAAFEQIRALGDLRVASALEPILFDPTDHQIDEFFFCDGFHV